jgi:hypothetical protein
VALSCCWLGAGVASAGEDAPYGSVVNGLRCAVALSPAALRVGDRITVSIKVENVSDRAMHFSYAPEYPAKQLAIRNEKGEPVNGQETARYEPGPPPSFFQLIQPKQTFSAQIGGRAALRFVRAADLPAKAEDRPVVLDWRDVAHEIGRPGRFTARLHFVAGDKAVALGKRCGVEPVWTGEMDSNEVAFTLRRMTREELDTAIKAFRTGTVEEQKEAIGVVAANADRGAARALMDILAKGHGPLTRPVTDALSAIQDPSVVPELLQLYKQPTAMGEYQQALLGAVSCLDPDTKKLAELFVGVLRSGGSVDARDYAAWQLVHLDHPQRVPALVQAAGDRDPRVRRTAVDVLGSIAGNTGAEAKAPFTAALIEVMKSDPDHTVRSRAAGALAQAGDKSAVQALLGALKDSSGWVGASASHALSRLAGPDAIPALEAFEKSATHPSQVDAAKNAIQAIKQRAAGQ